MTVSPITNWQLPGCGPACRPRQHDPIQHEEWGRQNAGPQVVETGPLTVNLTAGTATVNGGPVALSRIEWHLLAVLARRVGELITADELIVDVWGRNALSPSNIRRRANGYTERFDHHRLRVNIARLRARLGPAGRLVTMTIGRGYRLEVEPQS